MSYSPSITYRREISLCAIVSRGNLKLSLSEHLGNLRTKEFR